MTSRRSGYVALLLAATLANSGRAAEQTRRHHETGGRSALEFVRAYVQQSRFGPDRSTSATIATIPGTSYLAVYLKGETWCGSGGCTLLILKETDRSYEVVSKILTVKAPIVLLAANSEAPPTIGVWVQGGGIMVGYEAALAPAKGRYPVSPTMVSNRVPPGVGITLIGQDDQGVAVF